MIVRDLIKRLLDEDPNATVVILTKDGVAKDANGETFNFDIPNDIYDVEYLDSERVQLKIY